MPGIIGGTGLVTLEGLQLERRQTVGTPWGEPSAPLLHGRFAGRPVVFLPRHGSTHTIAPHEVNYRANIWALREAGVRRVIAVNAVGGIGACFAPGTLAIPDQLIDYSWGRAHTFSGGTGEPLQHIDFTEPYSFGLRALLLAAAARAGIDAHDGGVYGVTQGPRLETAAEIDRMARDGCGPSWDRTSKSWLAAAAGLSAGLVATLIGNIFYLTMIFSAFYVILLLIISAPAALGAERARTPEAEPSGTAPVA
jgi:purine nucleoside phosphorylase